MAQQSNSPRRVRRRLDEGDSSTSISSSRVADEVKVLLGHSPRRAQNTLTAKKLLLCLDYGTTQTSVSYITIDPDDPRIGIHQRRIQSIANWPKASQFVNAASPFVPSESWYRNGTFLWGYEVQHTLRSLPAIYDAETTNCIIQLPKLLLDNDGEGAHNDQLSRLKNALCEVGRNARDAIRDYLMEVFKHTHGQLKEHENFNKTWEVELVLCVPSNWSTYARLTMQEIMVDVVEETDMRGREFSIFIIDEPKAAVTFALGHEYIRENIEKGSNFVVCVAGGGTVGAATYKVRQEGPFRVDEIATPTGKDCGSSFINQAFIKETRKRLAHIPALGTEPEYSTEVALQEDLFRTFEHELKRNYDPADWDDQVSGNLRLFGLMEGPARDFGNGVFFLTKEQMDNYYRRSLEGTVDLIKEQLKQLKGQEVKVILLLGGFSRSLALKRRLNDTFGPDGIKVIHLDQDVDMTTSVSRGGVLRALNKEDGPRRRTRQTKLSSAPVPK